MSEKLLTPLEVMPPALRQLVEAVRKKHWRTSQNPLIASSTKLGKQLEVLENLWAELQWEHSISDLQQRATSLTKRSAQRPAQWQQRLPELRQTYGQNLQKRKQKLAAKKQRWELKKQRLRESLKASRRALAEQSRRLSLTSEQLANELPLGYDSEWRSAERRIEVENTLLRQAENSYKSSLREKKQTLTSAFNALKNSLNEQQLPAPRLLMQLQQQNAQRRADLPALVATWKAAATEREMRLHAELEAWKKKHPIWSVELPSWDDLRMGLQRLSDYERNLSDWNQQLQQRKQHISSDEQTMQAEWQRVNAKPCLSAPPSNEQRMDWLRKSMPLRTIWRDLFPLMTRCALLKAELLTGGFLDAEAYPEIELAWAIVEFR